VEENPRPVPTVSASVGETAGLQPVVMDLVQKYHSLSGALALRGVELAADFDAVVQELQRDPDSDRAGHLTVIRDWIAHARRIHERVGWPDYKPAV